MAETTVYLQVEPTWSRWTNADGEHRLAGMRVTKILQKRPARFVGVVVALKLKIPDGAFKPLRPEVTIDVPESALDYSPDVTVEMPDAE